MKNEVTAVVIAPPKFEIAKEVLDPLGKQCEDVIIVRGRQRALQRNIGLKRARTNFVLMVDTDEIIPENLVKRLLSNMTGAVAVVCALNLPDSKLPFLARLEEYLKAVSTFKMGYSSGRLYDRDLAVKIGGFKVVPGELTDFGAELLVRLRNNDYGMVFDPDAVITHLNKYTLRKLVLTGLSASSTKYNPLKALLLRIVSSPYRVMKSWPSVWSRSRDKVLLALHFYATFRQTLFFLSAVVRRFKARRVIPC